MRWARHTQARNTQVILERERALEEARTSKKQHESTRERAAREAEEATALAQLQEAQRIEAERDAAERAEAARKGRVSTTLRAKFAMFEN